MGCWNVVDCGELCCCVGPQELCAEHDQRCIAGGRRGAGTFEVCELVDVGLVEERCCGSVG